MENKKQTSSVDGRTDGRTGGLLGTGVVYVALSILSLG